MKRIKFITCLVFLLGAAISSQCQEITKNRKSQHTFEDISKAFNNPSKEYSTSPLWVWNDLVTKQKIATQLLEFKKENILQVFIHPRPGLITEYLSEEWFELAGYTLETAQELGMNVWIYDENSYPSGFAGGHVQAEMPESYNQGNAIVMNRGEQIDPEKKKDYFLVLKKEGDAFEKVDKWPQKWTDDYFAFEVLNERSSGWQGGFPYVDLLIPGVTEKFIELTMTGYEEALGDEFGKSVPGVFTDEPNIAPRAGRHSIRYTPELFTAFQERWGYDLKLHLPALYDEVGNFKKVRHNYYRLLLEMFIERWSKPWYEYTEDKNLAWTGHYWEHGWPSPHHGGDNMAMYAWHQIPGIDMLFNTYDERPDQFGNVRAVKEMSSVVNQMGRERALSETYGGAGWELSFGDMKRLGDWEYVLGVNFMNQHLSHMTLKGRRKGDYPQSFLSHAPYWDDYGILAKYFARLSLALSHGQQINNTLVIEPTTTAWMYYSPLVRNENIENIKNSFRQLIDDLEKLHLEYDLGAENIIKTQGSVNGTQFSIGLCNYDKIILPPNFKNIDDTTWKLLKMFVENGGDVFSFTIPEFINGESSNEVKELAEDHSNWIMVDNIQRPAIVAKFQQPGFLVERPLSINGKVYHMRRQFDDGQLVFWSNFNTKGSEEIQFYARGKAVSLLDPVSGEIEGHSFSTKEGMVQLSFNLSAEGSKLFFIHNEHKEELEKKPTVDDKAWEVLKTQSSRISATAPNSFTIDHVDLKIKDKTFKDIYFTAASDSAYKLNGLEQYGRTGYNPWSAGVQYETNIIDMGKRFTDDSGFTVTYNFKIARGFQPEELKAVVEWAHLYQVSLNGKNIKPIPGDSWLDPSFNVFDISNNVKPGNNRLTLSINPMSIYAEIEPVYLVGSFALEPQDAGFLITEEKSLNIGSWKKQGRPFYSQSVKYTKNLDVKNGMEYKIKLNEWNGTVARILVNDEQVGIIGWLPHEFNLTKFLDSGNQKVTVEVVGSLKNLLGPHHGNVTKGIASPWSWFIGPQKLPAGNDYQLIDYGLMEDYEVYYK